MSLLSSVGFLRSGAMYASFKFAGTEPQDIDRLMIFGRNGLMSSAHSLSSHVGHGSNADSLGGIRRISCVTSSQLRASNFVNWHPGSCVKVEGGEPSVSWRISTIFFVKKDMNSSAECSCFADVRFLPVRWFTVCASRTWNIRSYSSRMNGSFSQSICVSFWHLKSMTLCRMVLWMCDTVFQDDGFHAYVADSHHRTADQIDECDMLPCVIEARRSRMLTMVESYSLTISPMPYCEATSLTSHRFDSRRADRKVSYKPDYLPIYL